MLKITIKVQNVIIKKPLAQIMLLNSLHSRPKSESVLMLIIDGNRVWQAANTSKLWLEYSLEQYAQHINLKSPTLVEQTEQAEFYFLARQQLTDENWLGDGEWISLRDLMACLDEATFMIVGKAVQFSHFMQTHRYCGRCGHKMHPVGWELAQQCKKCKHRAYPRLSPCVIVAIEKDQQLLLARNKRSTGNWYSLIAGFVEPGETLEQAVKREVKEETNLEVDNIDYLQSQAWPFPHNLMVGFRAQYAGGTLKIDQNELSEANWFDKNQLPETSGTYSISGRMIKLIAEGKC